METPMETQPQPPEAAAQAPVQLDALTSDSADAAVADEDAVFASQLDDLSMCLVRMEAIVSMLEADLERRVASWRALAMQIMASSADSAGPSPRRRRARRRKAAVRNGGAGRKR